MMTFDETLHYASPPLRGLIESWIAYPPGPRPPLAEWLLAHPTPSDVISLAGYIDPGFAMTISNWAMNTAQGSMFVLLVAAAAHRCARWALVSQWRPDAVVFAALWATEVAAEIAVHSDGGNGDNAEAAAWETLRALAVPVVVEWADREDEEVG